MMLKKLTLAIGLVLAGSSAFAAGTSFEDFTPQLDDTVAGSLPESAPFVLSSPHFSQIIGAPGPSFRAHPATG